MGERMDEAWRTAAMQMLSRGKIRLLQRLASYRTGCLRSDKHSTTLDGDGEVEVEEVDAEVGDINGTTSTAVEGAGQNPGWEIMTGPSDVNTTPPLTWAKNNWW